MMYQNSELYAASLVAPFEVRGARIPDVAPYPSAVGSTINRFMPSAVKDAADNNKQYVGIYFGVDLTNNGIWSARINAVNAGAVTWTTGQHPQRPLFNSNFNLIRTVSMGVRIVNLGKLVDRGGALYVGYTPVKPTTTTLADLKMSSETEVYDFAHLDERGLQAVYIPMSRTPVKMQQAGLSYTGSTYVNPFITLLAANEFYDAAIVIWAEGPDGEDFALEFEQVHNWEAIPWLTTENLFDRKSVTGSEDYNSEALQTVGASIEKAGVTTPGEPVWKTKSIEAATAVGQHLLGWGMQQLVGLATRAIGGLFGAITEEDYRKHVIACMLERPWLSPAVTKGENKETFVEYYKRVLDDKRSVEEWIAEQKRKLPEHPDEDNGLELVSRPMVCQTGGSGGRVARTGH